HIADYIHSVGIPGWSFNYGMGQNLFPLFLRDPFDSILYLLGKNNVAYGIGYIEFIKVITGGLIFFLYLRTLEMKGFTCIIGGLLFSFTGFMILGGGWYIFSYEAINAALLLLAFEKLYKQNSWYLFPIAIAIFAIAMPFNLYIYGLFISIYACVRILEDKEKVELKDFLNIFGKMIFYGLLGVTLSSVFLFENVLQLIESPRGSGGNSYFDQLSSTPIFATGNMDQNSTAIMRLFSSDLIGSGINFKGWNNYLEAPIFYSGLITLLLFPQIFPFLNKRKKIIYGIFFAIWILPVIFPFFRYTFWLFTGDYYRAFSFMVSITLIFLTLRALDNISSFTKINIPLLIGTTVLLFILLSYPYFEKVTPNPIDKGVMSFVKAMLIVYTLLIIALSREKLKQSAQIILLLLLCIELGYMSNLTVNRRSLVTTKEMNQKIGYNDYSIEAIDFIKKRDSGFYRVDKNYHSTPAIHGSLNDGLVHDYYGTSAYNPFNQKYYILFLQSVGLARKDMETDSRWAQGLAGRPLLESIASVKYYLDRKHENPNLRMTHDSIAQFGDVKVFKSKYFIPLGFAFDRYMTSSDFEKLSLTQKDFSMLRAFIIEDAEKEAYGSFGKFELKDTLPLSSYTWDVYRDFVNELKKDTLTITERNQSFFKANIHLDKKKLLFLSIPFDKGWKAKVNGTEQEIKLVDAGMSGIMLDKGDHQLELEFTPRYLKKGLIVSLIALAVYGFLLWWSRRKKSQGAI
ncbi:MAG: YfhO family protein, partial [Bacteroidetes bacterium]|nr:YfhO family protein [Bacteroidota bacterium]